MTKRLEEAISEVTALPPDEQDLVAEWILAELHSERRWDQAFAASQDVLARLADEALDDDRAGRTTKLNPDDL